MSFADNLMLRITCSSCGFHVEKSSAWIRSNETYTCPNGHVCKVSQFPVVAVVGNSQIPDRTCC
jgi:hypothetical protein